LRLDEVFQAMLSEAAQTYARREAVPDQLLSSRGEEHLPTMRRRQEASHPVEQRAGIVAIPLLGHAGVKGHLHLTFQVMLIELGTWNLELGTRQGALGIEGHLKSLGCG